MEAANLVAETDGGLQAPPDLSEDISGVQVPTLQQRESGWWQRRDPRLKWGLFFSLIALIYIAPDWRWMAVACAVGLVTALTARPNAIWLTFALLVQFPNVLGLIILPALMDGGLNAADFSFGLRLGLGWIAAILFGISLLSTMDIPDLVRGLRGLGLPAAFSSLVGYTFLLIYQSLADFALLMRDKAIDLRSLRLWRPGELLREATSLVVPLIVTVARRGSVMAVAASSPASRLLPLPQKTFDLADLALLVLALVALVAAVTNRLGFDFLV